MQGREKPVGSVECSGVDSGRLLRSILFDVRAA